MSPTFAATTLALCLIAATQQSFVDTAPVSEGTGQESAPPQDSSVKELESLKHSIGKTLAMMKTQSEIYTENNGRSEAHAQRQAEVNENGKLLASVNQHVDMESKNTEDGKATGQLRTVVDIPSQNIHKSIVQPLAAEYPPITENGNRRSPATANMDTVGETGNSLQDNALTGVQYSPLDMAEYVFWTGDEKGVTLAIEEFLQEGFMTREEAISFLQEIKYNLDYLKNHYTQLGLNSREHSQNQEALFKYPSYTKNSIAEKPELKTTFDLSQLRQEVNRKRDPELPRPSAPVMSKTNGVDRAATNEEYEELLERLKVADFLYTEYSLEEVIYQLAKVMFTQSLTRGSAEAQQALQKFTNFLEMEAEQGHISRALEKKVLDVLIASLSDTLSEHPELLSAAQESLSSSANANGQHFLRQILEISSDDKAMRAAAAYTPYKQQSNERSIQLGDAMKEMKMANHVPLGLGKYKNP